MASSGCWHVTWKFQKYSQRSCNAVGLGLTAVEEHHPRTLPSGSRSLAVYLRHQQLEVTAQQLQPLVLMSPTWSLYLN